MPPPFSMTIRIGFAVWVAKDGGCRPWCHQRSRSHSLGQVFAWLPNDSLNGPRSHLGAYRLRLA